MRSLEEIYKSMTNIKPNDEQIQRIEDIRDTYKMVAASIVLNGGDNWACDQALTELETSLMWAVKSIVLEGKS